MFTCELLSYITLKVPSNCLYNFYKRQRLNSFKYILNKNKSYVTKNLRLYNFGENSKMLAINKYFRYLCVIVADVNFDISYRVF